MIYFLSSFFFAIVDDMKAIGQFSKNYLPILFNLFTSEDDDCREISHAVLEAVKAFLLITDNEVHEIYLNLSRCEYANKAMVFSLCY